MVGDFLAVHGLAVLAVAAVDPLAGGAVAPAVVAGVLAGAVAVVAVGIAVAEDALGLAGAVAVVAVDVLVLAAVAPAGVALLCRGGGDGEAQLVEGAVGVLVGDFGFDGGGHARIPSRRLCYQS